MKLNLMSMAELDELARLPTASNPSLQYTQERCRHELQRRERSMFVGFVHQRTIKKNLMSGSEFCNADYAPL